MKKFTKLLSLLLAVVMMLGLAACGSNGTTETAAPTAADVSAETKADTAAAPTAPNRAILGSITELSGDFRYPGWGGSSAGASGSTKVHWIPCFFIVVPRRLKVPPYTELEQIT